jgi:hypothetical protein
MSDFPIVKRKAVATAPTATSGLLFANSSRPRHDGLHLFKQGMEIYVEALSSAAAVPLSRCQKCARFLRAPRLNTPFLNADDMHQGMKSPELVSFWPGHFRPLRRYSEIVRRHHKSRCRRDA